MYDTSSHLPYHPPIYPSSHLPYHPPIYPSSLPQKVPWILNSTVRENILFGLPMISKKFEDAIEASALGPDLESLPNGLETEIGERGINLSGGQKARISFCRAVYRDADIVLLDDPLSAVDAHVAEKLFNRGICETLIAQGKTVVLVTHQVHLLDRCDQIIMVQDGRITSQVTPLPSPLPRIYPSPPFPLPSISHFS